MLQQPLNCHSALVAVLRCMLTLIPMLILIRMLIRTNQETNQETKCRRHLYIRPQRMQEQASPPMFPPPVLRQAFRLQVLLPQLPLALHLGSPLRAGSWCIGSLALCCEALGRELSQTSDTEQSCPEHWATQDSNGYRPHLYQQKQQPADGYSYIHHRNDGERQARVLSQRAS